MYGVSLRAGPGVEAARVSRRASIMLRGRSADWSPAPTALPTQRGNTETKMVGANKCAVDIVTEGLIVYSPRVVQLFSRSRSRYNKNKAVYGQLRNELYLSTNMNMEYENVECVAILKYLCKLNFLSNREVKERYIHSY